MELDWTTFVLEIVNFLVLVWILKRFLYRPVLAVIERRRAGIEKTLADAAATRAEAQALQEQYEDRLAQWEREKETARTALQSEMNAQRSRLTEALENTLEQERRKSRVLEERRLAEERRRCEEAALAQAARFGARLLARVAGPELEPHLIDAAIEDLEALAPARVESLRAAWSEERPVVIADSAHELDARHREKLTRALARVLGEERPPLEFRRNPDLLAGLRIRIGPWVLRANLRDELGFFAEAARLPERTPADAAAAAPGEPAVPGASPPPETGTTDER